MWEKILKHMSIDELHESTYKYIKRLEEDYKTQVMVFAKERGMLLDLDAANGDAIKGLLQVIFEPFEDEKQAKETLFAFKLALFEFDAIKDSQERELKTALRKAESITASLRIALDIVEGSKKAD